jgi:hypothetical protein
LIRSGLPVVGSEQAEALLDQDRPKNEQFDNDASAAPLPTHLGPRRHAS